MMRLLSFALLLAAILITTRGAQASTLDTVKARDQLNCGVNIGLAGFSQADEKGVWRGLDVDFCRAIAAAVLGDAKRVNYVALTAEERFAALRSGKVDVLVRNTTQTFTRDTGSGLRIAGVNFYDGQGFATRKSAGVTKIADLNGATICVLEGSTHELNLADWFRQHGLTFKPVVVKTQELMRIAFQAGHCDAVTQDGANLASLGTLSGINSADWVILPERISKEPLGPIVRNGDENWLAIVRWVVMATVEAEELGVSQANVDKMLADSKSPTVHRLLGKTGEFGKALGLDNAWAYAIIRQVGNYGDIYTRNVGPKTAMKLPRGLNDLWSHGGQMYSIPFR